MAVYELITRVAIGIDEVGRGALAGPVVVAAAMVGGDALRSAPRSFGILKDSKKLSARQRDLWYAYFAKHPKITFAVARVYPRQIEKRNISGAANLAAMRAFHKVLTTSKTRVRTPKVFLDGGLYLADKDWQAQHTSAKTLVKADEKIPSVAVASIIAKVQRDRFMKKLAGRHREYGFDIHKGYGTKIHFAAIAKYGLCDAHRLTFIPKAIRI